MHTHSDPVKAAFEILDLRYDHPGLIITKALAELDNLPTDCAQDYDALNTLVRLINDLSCAIYTTREDPERLRRLLAAILNRLPPDLRLRYFAQCNQRGTAESIDGLVAFLVAHAGSLRRRGRVFHGQCAGHGRTPSQNRTDFATPDTTVMPGAPKPDAAPQTSAQPPPGHCPLCQVDGHDLPECPSYQELAPAQRLEIAVTKRIHLLCLRSHGAVCSLGPQARRCPINGCAFRHHPLIHGAPFREDLCRRRSHRRATGSVPNPQDQTAVYEAPTLPDDSPDIPEPQRPQAVWFETTTPFQGAAHAAPASGIATTPDGPTRCQDTVPSSDVPDPTTAPGKPDRPHLHVPPSRATAAHGRASLQPRLNGVTTIPIVLTHDPTHPDSRTRTDVPQSSPTRMDTSRQSAPTCDPQPAAKPPSEVQARKHPTLLLNIYADTPALQHAYNQALLDDPRRGQVSNLDTPTAAHPCAGDTGALPSVPTLSPDTPDGCGKPLDAAAPNHGTSFTGFSPQTPLIPTSSLGTTPRIQTDHPAIGKDSAEHCGQTSIPDHRQPQIAPLGTHQLGTQSDVHMNTDDVISAFRPTAATATDPDATALVPPTAVDGPCRAPPTVEAAQAQPNRAQRLASDSTRSDPTPEDADPPSPDSDAGHAPEARIPGPTCSGTPPPNPVTRVIWEPQAESQTDPHYLGQGTTTGRGPTMGCLSFTITRDPADFPDPAIRLSLIIDRLYHTRQTTAGTAPREARAPGSQLPSPVLAYVLQPPAPATTLWIPHSGGQTPSGAPTPPRLSDISNGGPGTAVRQADMPRHDADSRDEEPKRAAPTPDSVTSKRAGQTYGFFPTPADVRATRLHPPHGAAQEETWALSFECRPARTVLPETLTKPTAAFLEPALGRLIRHHYRPCHADGGPNGLLPALARMRRQTIDVRRTMLTHTPRPNLAVPPYFQPLPDPYRGEPEAHPNVASPRQQATAQGDRRTRAGPQDEEVIFLAQDTPTSPTHEDERGSAQTNKDGRAGPLG